MFILFTIFSIPAITAGLNDTGIATCSNANQSDLPCPVVGYPGQDAEYGANRFDFTKLDASGNTLPASVTGHVCVRDNVTGLIWEVKIDDGGLWDKDWTYTWYDSNSATNGGSVGTPSGGACHASGRCDTEKYAQDVNAVGLYGFHDWRVPTVKELVGIIDYSRPYPGPTIDVSYFPNTPTDRPHSDFWSSSLLGSAAWEVYFAYGGVYPVPRDNGTVPKAVRLVRGGQSFFSLTDNGDGTVTQNPTGLMWAQCSEGQSGTGCATGSTTTGMIWSEALIAARDSRLSGYSDWRLPNAKELQSLVDYSRNNPSIDSTYFPNTPSLDFWSSSPGGYGAGSAWCVDFKDGSIHGDYGRCSGRVVQPRAVRLVRDVQPVASFAAAIGVFRASTWYLDANGNGAWDGCSAEFCFTGFGQAGDMPVSGNWDGGDKSFIGVLRSGTGEWFIDHNGNRQWDGCVADGCYSGFGAPGDLPVAGDWNGNGAAKIGVFRNGQWYLDANGNGAWDGCGTDICLNFGQAGDLPVAGNWNGGTQAGVGVFRNGTWYLDSNGNGQWDGCQQDGGQDLCLYNSFGQAGDLPVAGDWNGDGKSKVGVFRNGTWYLDYNGNGQWDGCGIDRCYIGSFGQASDLPVAGKW